MEGIINPTNAEMDLKDGVGEKRVCDPSSDSRRHVSPAAVSGNALEKAGGRDFLEGVKELRKAQAPLEVAAGTNIFTFFSYKPPIRHLTRF